MDVDATPELFSYRPDKIYCPDRMQSSSRKKLKGESVENIYVKEIPLKGGKIVLMNHPASITVYKYVSVEVLSGSVSILGYEITPQNKPIEVFSSEKTGLIEIKTETFERIWKKKEYSTGLDFAISYITDSRDTTNEVLSRFGNATVAVFIKRVAYPLNVEFLELYCPKALEFNLVQNKTKKDEFVLKRFVREPLEFHVEHEKLASEVSHSIRNAKLVEANNAPRIMVIGPRNSGKSTLLRFLLNKILTLYDLAYYLDTDPGQSEFTPPGVVSLVKVAKPIIGPPFCHQQKPVKMMFTGSSSPTFVEMYSKCVSKLMQLYTEKYAQETLFVNTMGWMEGTGLQCLINTMVAVKPTILIEITTLNEMSMFDYRDYLSSDDKYYQISCKHERKLDSFSAKQMRDFSLISYLGKFQSPYFGLVPLNEVKPFYASWDEIPVYIIPEGNVLASRMIEAINESIVALCSVPESVILESNIPEFPKTLEPDPEHECLGYGLVKAVDEKQHLLYIVSPLKPDEWKQVNAIIKGRIPVPDALILNEEIYDVPLPYTDERMTVPPIEEEEKMDISMVSSNYETDATPVVKNAHGSCKKYRKKIPSRYRNISRK